MAELLRKLTETMKVGDHSGSSSNDDQGGDASQSDEDSSDSSSGMANLEG